MVVHLLVFGRIVSHKGTARQHQIRTCGEQILIDKEIFLFPAQIGSHLSNIRIEIMANGSRSLIDSSQRLFQRHFIVERFTCIRDKHGRNHQCIANDKYRRGRIPCRITAGFKSGTDATTWERRGIWLLLNKFLAREFLYHTTFPVMLHKGIMLLGSSLGQWLEPMGAMGNSQLGGPGFLAFGY